MAIMEWGQIRLSHFPLPRHFHVQKTTSCIRQPLPYDGPRSLPSLAETACGAALSPFHETLWRVLRTLCYLVGSFQTVFMI
jgi:hypothetical protein